MGFREMVETRLGSARSPMETIQDVLERLDGMVAAAITRQHREGYFAAIYRRVTAEIVGKLGTGYFDDDARMARLDVVFASRYFEAFDSFRAGAPDVPAAWNVAFVAGHTSRLTTLQHLLAGIVPHMLVDLGVASATVCTRETLDDLRDDFVRINELLGGIVPVVRDNLARLSPFTAGAIKLFRGVETKAVDLQIGIGRELAWHFAKALVESPAERRPQLIRHKHEHVARIAREVVNPGHLERLAIHAASILDHDDVVEVIQVLSQP